MATGTPAVRKMPLTLREFSQWLDWVAGGKVGTPRTGEDAPGGELFAALVLESLAKEAIKPLEADKKRAMEWLEVYGEVGVTTDPQVTGEFQYRRGETRVIPEMRKVNSERMKSRYPALYAQSRTWVPYRSVTLSRVLKAPPAPELADAVPAVPVDLPPNRNSWGVSWGLAFHRYQERIEQMKVHKKVIEDAVDVMGRLLQDEAVKAEYARHWDGHGPLQFEDGTKLQLDRLQFNQDRALEVLELHPEVDLSAVIDVVPEHEVAGSRMLVKIQHEGADGGADAGGLGNPFE